MSTTDLEDSIPAISGLIAPMDGQHVLVRTIVGPQQSDNETSLIYMNSEQSYQYEPTVTKEQLDEMKRRLQRRQRGIKSEECSYLTKLDPTMIEGSKEQLQSPVLAKIVPNRFVNSTGSVRAPALNNKKMQ